MLELLDLLEIHIKNHFNEQALKKL